MFVLFYLIQAELFDAPTRKKEAVENLHIPKFLESEVSQSLMCITVCRVISRLSIKFFGNQTLFFQHRFQLSDWLKSLN